jgi:predicted enzyme involved in methoxymalonyl-ACP biosynthesis
MLNKTNQFNMTTTRHTESTLKLYLKKNEVVTMVCKLEDKFGKHGITGLLTARKSGNRFIIVN